MDRNIETKIDTETRSNRHVNLTCFLKQQHYLLAIKSGHTPPPPISEDFTSGVQHSGTSTLGAQSSVPNLGYSNLGCPTIGELDGKMGIGLYFAKSKGVSFPNQNQIEIFFVLLVAFLLVLLRNCPIYRDC